MGLRFPDNTHRSRHSTDENGRGKVSPTASGTHFIIQKRTGFPLVMLLQSSTSSLYSTKLLVVIFHLVVSGVHSVVVAVSLSVQRGVYCFRHIEVPDVRELSPVSKTLLFSSLLLTRVRARSRRTYSLHRSSWTLPKTGQHHSSPRSRRTYRLA